MAKPFKSLVENLPPDRKAHIKNKTDVLKNEMTLYELRQALQLTQEELANTLKMKQTAISKFEHQSDIFISTLRKILAAMGADLQIIARFPDGDISINQFNDFHQDKNVIKHKKT